MASGRQTARWLAAMILAIVAFALPSAVSAHEGHGHRSHHTASSGPAGGSAAAERIMPELAIAPERTALGFDASESGDGRGLCCCCAPCCTPGILSTAAGLTLPVRAHAVLRPQDEPPRGERGPDSPSEPPRPLA